MAHHRLPRTLRAPVRSPSCRASICTRLALQAMRNSPATQASCSCDVVMVCTRWPVTGSVFTDIAVRVLLWRGAVVAFMSVVLVELEISDGPIVLFLSANVFANASEEFARARKE